MLCPKCNAVLNDSYKFCHDCGFRVQDISLKESIHTENPNEEPLQTTIPGNEKEEAFSSASSDVKQEQTASYVKSRNTFTRMKNILVRPKSEWDVIDREKPKVLRLIFGHLLILSVIPFVSAFIGYWLIGRPVNDRWYRDYHYGLSSGLACFLISFIAPVIAAIIINNICPKYNIAKGFKLIMRLTAYSLTPMIIANAFFLIPYFRFMAFVLGLYGIIIIWFGTIKIMRTSKEKHLVFFFACCGIILGVYYVIYLAAKIIIDAFYLPFIRNS